MSALKFGQQSPGVVIFAEPDPDDQVIFKTVYQKLGYKPALKFVFDGRALLELLRSQQNQTPDLLILDLKDARDLLETLNDLKRDPGFRSIPIFVFTTARNEAQFGGNSHRYGIPYAVKGDLNSLIGSCKQAMDQIRWEAPLCKTKTETGSSKLGSFSAPV